MTAAQTAALIDHTLLKPDATASAVEQCCDEAIEHGFASVCVNAVHVPLVSRRLRQHASQTCAVVGFPLGAVPSEIKAEETRWVVANGADEVDMVIDIGALKAGDLEHVRTDIAAVREACGGQVLKVIIETCLLSDEEKEEACRLAVEVGADFVKTSTGFSTGGASVADVALMRRVVGPSIGVKASGGVRTLADLRSMVEAGATRIGASAGVAIVKEVANGAPSEQSTDKAMPHNGPASGSY